ncbi:MAG: hypothetical protein ACLQDV_28745 [Candidatus Binataceae bacterium]
MGYGRAAAAILSLCVTVLCAGIARAATSTPPAEFAGVPLGTTLGELKQLHPEVARNPDSDRQFQVYQTLALKGVSEKSAVAFNIYQGRVVGGQVMLDSDNARYWFDQMVERYGKPDSCTYCTAPELVIANWMWGNGVRLHIGGEMLALLTEDGAAQRQQWVARGDSSIASADNGDEDSDLGDQAAVPVVHQKVRKKVRPPPAVAHRQPAGWRAYYQDAKSRVERWLGWSK